MKGSTNDFPLINVAAGIIWRRGRILAAQRPDGKELAGYWELPGGKLEGDETPGQALCRELAEELGINVLEFRPFETVRHCYADRGFMVCLHFFIVENFSGEPSPLEDANLRWIQLSKALELDFLPPDIRVLHKLQMNSSKLEQLNNKIV